MMPLGIQLMVNFFTDFKLQDLKCLFNWICVEQWLATAATNGAVVLWNIQKSIKLKQETVYNDHKRTVNKVLS